MKCIHCEEEILERAKFCPKCKNQVKCRECSAELIVDSTICIECGKEVLSSESNTHNTIEFNETKSTRSFKASFTNEVGQSIGEAFGIILASGKPGVAKLVIGSKEGVSTPTQDAEFVEVQEGDELKAVNSLFRERDGKFTLLETRLKAKSKRDFSIRLTILFLYYKLLNGIDRVPRSNITGLLQDASVEDGNWRTWLTHNNLVGVHDDGIELKAPGRDAAKEYLADISNPDKDDNWKVGTAPSPKRSKKKQES